MSRELLLPLILLVAAASFLLRFVPMALLRGPIRSPRLVAFVGLLPYSILAAMVVPGVFSSAGSVPASAAGFAVALALALLGKSLPVVAAAAAAVAAAVCLCA